MINYVFRLGISARREARPFRWRIAAFSRLINRRVNDGETGKEPIGQVRYIHKPKYAAGNSCGRRRTASYRVRFGDLIRKSAGSEANRRSLGDKRCFCNEHPRFWISRTKSVSRSRDPSLETRQFPKETTSRGIYFYTGLTSYGNKLTFPLQDCRRVRCRRSRIYAYLQKKRKKVRLIKPLRPIFIRAK